MRWRNLQHYLTLLRTQKRGTDEACLSAETSTEAAESGFDGTVQAKHTRHSSSSFRTAQRCLATRRAWCLCTCKVILHGSHLICAEVHNGQQILRSGGQNGPEGADKHLDDFQALGGCSNAIKSFGQEGKRHRVPRLPRGQLSHVKAAVGHGCCQSPCPHPFHLLLALRQMSCLHLHWQRTVPQSQRLCPEEQALGSPTHTGDSK